MRNFGKEKNIILSRENNRIPSSSPVQFILTNTNSRRCQLTDHKSKG